MIDLWYKNAVIYCLDVQTFVDSDGDGIGDFAGLSHRLDHISGIGANCIWLMPFFPSPHRDNGYDILDYYDVDRRLGTPGDFVNFTREARERGIRVITDLVVNHTSIDHPWFQEARSDPESPRRDFYIWRDHPPESASDGIVFPGHQETTWSYDEAAGQYYYHRFFAHQPDLNIANPEVQEEIERIMGFWIELGVSGFRIDAAPFLIELKGETPWPWEDRHQYLTNMRDFLQWRQGDAIMLAEANVSHDEVLEYFGDGRRMHMVFGFLVNQMTFLALAREDAGPIRRAYELVPEIPETGQWATFLRNHDELDLARLSEQERGEVFDRFAPREEMRAYQRGIRRRLASMLDGESRKLKMTYALLFSLPGTPVIYYGEEIGMGEDLDLPERDAVRTPMQWSSEENAGFSTAPADDLIRPVLRSGPFGYELVNVTDQVRDPESLMNAIEKMIRARRGTPEFGWGDYEVLDVDAPGVFAHRCDWRGNTVVALHNLSSEPCECRLAVESRIPVASRDGQATWTEIIADREYADATSDAPVQLGAYGYRWLRLEGTRR